MCCCGRSTNRGVAKCRRVRPFALLFRVGKLEAQSSNADRFEVMGQSGHERMVHAGSRSMCKHEACFCRGWPLHQSGHADLLVDRNCHRIRNGRCHCASMRRIHWRGFAGERVRHSFYTVRAYLRQHIYGRRIYRGRHEYRDTPCPAEEPGTARRCRYRPRPLAGRLFRRHTPLIGAHAIRTRLDAPCRDVRPESRAWQSCKRRTPRYGYLPRCTSGSETDSSSTS